MICLLGMSNVEYENLSWMTSNENIPSLQALYNNEGRSTEITSVMTLRPEIIVVFHVNSNAE